MSQGRVIDSSHDILLLNQVAESAKDMKYVKYLSI